jgi:hypothetical protein
MYAVNTNKFSNHSERPMQALLLYVKKMVVHGLFAWQSSDLL